MHPCHRTMEAFSTIQLDLADVYTVYCCMFINATTPIDTAALGDAIRWTVDEDVAAIYSAQHAVLHLVDADTDLPLQTFVKVTDERTAETLVQKHFPDFRA